MKHVLIFLAAAVLASCEGAGGGVEPAGSPRSCSSGHARREISGTIRAFFAALARDDDAAVARLTTAGFRAFELGRRYTGPELSRAIAEAHRSGRVFQWNIGPVDTRIDCNIAFATWENSGAAGTAERLEPRAWLESALLVRQDDRWVIDFLHSSRKDPRD